MPSSARLRLGASTIFPLRGIEYVEAVVGAEVLDIALTQELAIVEAHEQRHVGLLDHEVGLVELPPRR